MDQHQDVQDQTTFRRRYEERQRALRHASPPAQQDATPAAPAEESVTPPNPPSGPAETSGGGRVNPSSPQPAPKVPESGKADGGEVKGDPKKPKK